MNENEMRSSEKMLSAEDWNRIRPIDKKNKLIQNQVEIIKRILDETKGELVVLGTIHGVVASASHSSGYRYSQSSNIMPKHLAEKPEIVGAAFRAIAESTATFAEACVEAGVDGIYYAALGGEKHKFTDEQFEKYIKPCEMMVLDAVHNVKGFNVLHMCKDNLNLIRYKDYPVNVVNWAIHENNLSLEEGKEIFKDKTILGGLDDRSGVLVNGTMEDIEKEVHCILDRMGTTKFILGADCTLPTEIEYSRIKKVVEAAKNYK
jgi:uroporphyrinogen decarboxylase